MKSFITALLIVCFPLAASAQHTVDFASTSEKKEPNDFTKDLTIDVKNFQANSELSVIFSDGTTTVIKANELHSATYNARTNDLKITVQVSGAKMFLEANNKSDAGTVTVAKGNTKLLTIEKIVPTDKRPSSSSFDPAGYALMDGIGLVNCTKRSELVKILKLYMGDEIDIVNVKTFLQNQSNRYLKDPQMMALVDQKEDDNVVVGSAKDIAKKAVAAAGDLNVTSFADGLAKFLVKRSKEELSAAFFDRFQTEITKYPDLASVFPETYRTLQVIGDEIYMFQAYIQTLREAFQRDLAALLTNLPSIIDNHRDYFDQQPELEAILSSGLYVGRQVQNKKHPGEIIEEYPIEFVDGFANVKGSFQSLKLLSMSLKDEKSDGYWADASTLKKLTAKDHLLIKLYLGLLQEQSDTIEFIGADKKVVKLSAVIDAAYDDINATVPAYQKYIRGLSERLNSLEASIKDLEGSKPDSVVFENYYAVVSQSVDLMRFLTDAENLPRFPKNLHLADSVEKYFDAIDGASNLAIDIHRRNYASAVMNTVYLYDLAIEEFKIAKGKKLKRLELTKEQADSIVAKTKAAMAYLKMVKEVKRSDATVTTLVKSTEELIEKQKGNIKVDVVTAVDIAQRVLDGNDEAYRQALEASETNARLAQDKAIKDLEEFARKKIDTLRSHVSALMMKYGSFMAAIVQAKNADQVEAGIEAIALPAGSSRIKRTVRFNVAFNAYVGLHWGNEYINAGPTRTGWSTIYGVSAPVGVATSVRLGKKLGSATLFASIIDIGAVTSFRFKDDVAELPPVKLQNIFAPGLYAVYGIPKTPLSIGYGWQKGPQLREVAIPDPNVSGATMNTTVDANAYRWTFFLAVDIPLLNFYSASR